ncbi:MAG: PHP domain-containing protein [Roseburia sp.]
MDQPIVDLHVHSTASDGTVSPAELISLARAAGLSAIALTDHDTTAGVPEAAQAAERSGIELIPGIELSTTYGDKEIHIVGLFIDPKNELLSAKTKEFRDCRDRRNEKMVAALQQEGFPITMEQLEQENPDCVITRANIARFLFHHGYIKSVQEAFDKYIGDGCRCYVGRFKISPMEAAALIRQAGGVAILAHPLLYHMSSARLQQLIDDLKAAGLDGIEAIYSTYTPGEERLMKELASKNGLLISGGSDFHGSNKPSIRLGSGKGSLFVPYSVLSALRQAAEHR